MTDTDRVNFAECFATVARAQGGPADLATVQAYFDALKDLSFESVQTAAERLVRTGGDWFPKAARWHEEARSVQRGHIEALYVPPGGRDDPWKNECEDCQDTGWVQRWVEKGELRYSQVQKREVPAMYRHQEARACLCRPTNRTYQRRHGGTSDDPEPPTTPQAAKVLKRAGWRT